MPQRLLLTSVAAIAAETCTYPIDIVKTRLQLQGELSRAAGAGGAATHKGALATAASIVRHEGLRGLYAGLAPAAVRHVFYSGTRITVYETLREWARGRLGAERASGLGVALALGLTAGALGQAVAVPADLIKVRPSTCFLVAHHGLAAGRTCLGACRGVRLHHGVHAFAPPMQVRMQADGRLVASGQLAAPRYRGLVDAARQILASEGGAGEHQWWRWHVQSLHAAPLCSSWPHALRGACVCARRTVARRLARRPAGGAGQPGGARHVRLGELHGAEGREESKRKAGRLDHHVAGQGSAAGPCSTGAAAK